MNLQYKHENTLFINTAARKEPNWKGGARSDRDKEEIIEIHEKMAIRVKNSEHVK